MRRMPTQLPKGARIYLPDEAARKRHVESALLGIFERWGYREIVTPTFEYLDVLSTGTDESVQASMFTFFDRETGRVLALRADITPQTARIVATRLRDEPKPVSLAYVTSVFRYDVPHVSPYPELYQAGVELIANAGLHANFTATPTVGPAALNVQFTDQTFSDAPGGVSTWGWDFDNDTVIDSTAQNPSHTYVVPGAYTVSLTVTDSVNPMDTRTKTNYITVLGPVGVPGREESRGSLRVEAIGNPRRGGASLRLAVPGPEPVRIQIAAFLDDRYVYAIELQSRAPDHWHEHQAALIEVARSIEPLPRQRRGIGGRLEAVEE